MTTCDQCHIVLADHEEVCPLCHHTTVKAEGEKRTINYPNVHLKKQRQRFLLQIYMAAAVVIFVIGLIVNYYDQTYGFWSMILGGGLIYGYLSLRISFSSKTGHRGKLISLTIFAILLIVGIDIEQGYTGWSVNYCLPIAIGFLNITIIVLIFVNHRNWPSYLIFQIGIIATCLVFFVLHLTGALTEPRLSVMVSVASILCFVCTLIIGGERARTELKRRFHIRR